LTPEDDSPDYVVPLARNVERGEVERVVAICESGVGVRHCQQGERSTGGVHDIFSAHQGVKTTA